MSAELPDLNTLLLDGDILRGDPSNADNLDVTFSRVGHILAFAFGHPATGLRLACVFDLTALEASEDEMVDTVLGSFRSHVAAAMEMVKQMYPEIEEQA